MIRVSVWYGYLCPSIIAMHQRLGVVYSYKKDRGFLSYAASQLNAIRCITPLLCLVVSMAYCVCVIDSRVL